MQIQQTLPSLLKNQPKEQNLSRNSIVPPISNKEESESAVPSQDDFSYSSKLTNVEAQRIMAVLQEMQKKVQLVGLIQYYILINMRQR
jgi:hypothetical protein